MKTGKIVKINNNQNFNVKFGTVDNNTKKTVFIKLTSWCLPIKNEELDYNKIVKKINKNIKTFSFNYFNNINLINENKIIVDLDLKKTGIVFNKKTFIDCEITLYASNGYYVSIKEHKDILKDFVSSLEQKILLQNEYFQFTKRK